jgi:hypothetical protein
MKRRRGEACSTCEGVCIQGPHRDVVWVWDVCGGEKGMRGMKISQCTKNLVNGGMKWSQRRIEKVATTMIERGRGDSQRFGRERGRQGKAIGD